MGLFDFLFKKKKEENDRPIQRNVLNLQVNDIVTYDLEDYIVVGKITYNDSGYEWHAYNLKGESRSIWLAAELDDELEIGIYERVTTSVGPSIPQKLTIDGTTYYMEEHGLATITHVSGRAGAVVGQKVEYWDFESEDEEYLSVEKWGGDLELSKGYSIGENELKIIAGS
ncbi:DUF4178 domain-containing protein [Microaerobacter geothermalis]|uniref:DUF4178 domain-containing protein n=1 Tax=Microaerobacter geothermalis TaxID=674972 RepID=UPI001F42BBFD|nr:DUF4178 domain-containing protein [Microaerobacter geothermalis]MCF6092554.1 DUF4178 domain-containing protein [Microaerobacter geothermalis]